MAARNPSALLGVLAICILVGCAAGAGVGATTVAATASPAITPNPVATPSQTTTPTPKPISAADVLAVAGHFWWGGSPDSCHYLECPITPRLANRMGELIEIQSGYKAGGGDLWCRCQDSSPTPTVTAEVTPGGGTAIVNFGWGKVDFLMVVQDGSLLVDDTQCTGLGPTTSIYRPEGLMFVACD
jgi:hypothetical protein